MATNLGRIALLPRGDYSAGTAYTFLDVVRYTGASYVCKQNTTGNLPTNTTYWMLLNEDGLQGIRGDAGVNGTNGTNGINGTNGSVWYSGTTVSGGVDGDYFFKTDTSDIYKKVAGSWGSPIANIKGSAGATGSTGATGATGASGQVFSYVGAWSSKPTSLSNNYTDRIFITDIGIGGSEWYWDGARYRAVGGQVVLRNDRTTLTASSNSALSKLTSSTFSFIQAGDIIEINCILKKATTVSAFDVGCYFGSTDSPAGAANTATLSYIASSGSNTILSYGFRSAWKVLSNTTFQPLFLHYSPSSYGGVTVALNDITLSSANLLSNLIVGVSAKTTSGTVDNITLDNTLITLRTCG